MLPNPFDHASFDTATITGSVFYEGPSRIDRQPIVAIATVNTNNRKTGGMVQTWIVRADVDPVTASRTGRDASVCGDCVHRGTANGTTAKGRSCYVLVHQAPLAIYRAYKNGRYPYFDDEVAHDLHLGLALRMGSYGDPAAVPFAAWRKLLDHAHAHVGYTHQWRRKKFRWLRKWAMASCDSLRDYEEAGAAGWRAFRVRPADAPVLATEVACPASEEMGKRRTCSSCLACDGRSRPGQRDIVIIGHGSAPIRSNVALNVSA